MIDDNKAIQNLEYTIVRRKKFESKIRCTYTLNGEGRICLFSISNNLLNEPILDGVIRDIVESSEGIDAD